VDLERFVGCKVRAFSDCYRAHVMFEGIVASAREQEIEINEPVAAKAVKGVLLDKDGEAQGEERVYYVGDTNVLYKRNSWLRSRTFPVIIDLPRASLAPGDTILHETDNGIFGKSIVALNVLEITDIRPNCLGVCVVRDGYAPQIILISTDTVPVILDPTE